MNSLREFSELQDNEVMDKNTPLNIIKRIKAEEINYPNIVIQLQNQESESLFLPSRPNVLQTIIIKFAEEGFWTLCEELTKYLKSNQSVFSIFAYPLRFLMKFSSRGYEVSLLPNMSRTKSWLSSNVRCMAWHPQVFKLAIASSHDIVYIFIKSGTKATLNKTSQNAILSLAWRPFSSGTLAIGCEKGIFIWNIEFNNMHIKPTINNNCQFIRKDHRFISGLSWNNMGDLLLSCALTSNTMYIWSYPLQTQIPLRKISCNALNFVLWSPDNSKVFTCSTNDTFRIWSTEKWTKDDWSLNTKLRVQCACWSNCSSILLFSIDSLPLINAIDFRKSNIFDEPTKYKKVAWPIINLQNENTHNKIFGGVPSDMCWDQYGKRLAITFKNCHVLAIFQTNINSDCVNSIPYCIIQGRLDEVPSVITFQPIYEQQGTLLTIGWSNGVIEYVPFPYSCKSNYFNKHHEYQQNETSFLHFKVDNNFSKKSVNTSIEYL